MVCHDVPPEEAIREWREGKYMTLLVMEFVDQPEEMNREHYDTVCDHLHDCAWCRRYVGKLRRLSGTIAESVTDGRVQKGKRFLKDAGL